MIKWLRQTYLDMENSIQHQKQKQHFLNHCTAFFLFIPTQLIPSQS